VVKKNLIHQLPAYAQGTKFWLPLVSFKKARLGQASTEDHIMICDATHLGMLSQVLAGMYTWQNCSNI
jgi:hypothetical protein